MADKKNERYGVIDIGSNTIRTIVYEKNEKKLKQLLNDREFSSIISYKENGVLKQDGMERLYKTVRRMADLCRLLECREIFCFATASLRSIKNTDEVLALMKKTEVDVRILTGEEEAQYDFEGLMLAVPDKKGIGLDLGGGSCQIFEFDRRELSFAKSFPIGSLAMNNLFVRGIVPTEEESEGIRRFVSERLKEAPELLLCEMEKVFAMGGTARAAAKLHRAYYKKETSMNGYELSVEELEALYEFVHKLESEGLRMVERVIPERMGTIIPGMVVLITVCRYLGVKNIQIVKNGVREGYLWKNLKRFM